MSNLGADTIEIDSHLYTDESSVPKSNLRPVTLELNSLYIATSQILPSPGKFHWAFFLTDSSGRSMRYHWTTFYEKTSDKDPAEHIVAKEVIGPSTFTATSGITFLFVKILGFKPTTFEEFVAMYPNIFDPSMGYPALKDNRRNGISCRTWIFRVLSRMVQVGRIVRSAELESLNKLEQFMTERSLANEKSLNEGSGVFNAEITEY